MKQPSTGIMLGRTTGSSDGSIVRQSRLGEQGGGGTKGWIILR